MASQALYKLIKILLENNSFLTHTDIAKKLKKDKSKVSGCLMATTSNNRVNRNW